MTFCLMITSTVALSSMTYFNDTLLENILQKDIQQNKNSRMLVMCVILPNAVSSKFPAQPVICYWFFVIVTNNWCLAGFLE